MSEQTRPLDDVIPHTPASRLLSALLAYLREHPRPWWNTTVLREAWPTSDRLGWFEDQPEVRARVTHALTGLAPMAARDADVAFQADLIERVFEAGDVSVEDWEAAFPTDELAAYGPGAVIWQTFRERFPWDDVDSDDQDLLVWLLGELLEERVVDGETTEAIMTPLYVRSAIDVRVWQECMPLEVRVQVDGRRLRKALEHKPFTWGDELAVVKIERVVEFIPANQLVGVFDALERVLPGLAGPVPLDDEADATESARA